MKPLMYIFIGGLLVYLALTGKAGDLAKGLFGR